MSTKIPLSGTLILGFLTGFIVAVCVLTFSPGDSLFHWRHVIRNYLTDEPVIFLKKQSLSSSYIVPYVRMKEPGYISVVYADIFGTPGVDEDFAGLSAYLKEGTYRNVTISVSQVVPDRDFFVCLQAGDEEKMHGTLLDSASLVVCEKVRVK